MSRELAWFDLSRFNMALKVVPANPLRGLPLCCIEIDVEAEEAVREYMIAAFGGPGASDDTRLIDARRDAILRWHEALRALGFGDGVYVSPEGRPKARMFSARTSFTLGELATIVPGLAASDHVKMPVAEVVLPSPAAEQAEAWAAFDREVLTPAGEGVWMDARDLLNVPYADARPLKDIEVARDRVHPMLGSPLIPRFNNLPMQLVRAQVRSNALVQYYLDRETARLDGVPEEFQRQVSLAHALPLWLSPEGRITAVRDVRYLPEVMGVRPQNLYGESESTLPGFVTTVLRQGMALAAPLRAALSTFPARVAEAGASDLAELEAEISGHTLALWAYARAHRLRGMVGPLPVLAEDGAPLRDWSAEGRQCRALTAMSAEDISAWASGLADIAGVGADPLPSKPLIEAFQSLAARQAKLALDTANAEAQARLAAVAAAVAEKETVPARKRGKAARSDLLHVDTGEKIGGARKDFHLRALTMADVQSMNPLEREKFVVKASLWPPLNYAELREEGADPRAIFMLKRLKDALPTAPDLSGRLLTEEGRMARIESFVDCITAARHHLGAVRQWDDLQVALSGLYRELMDMTPEDRAGDKLSSVDPVWGLGSDVARYAWNAARAVDRGNRGGFLSNDDIRALDRKMSIRTYDYELNGFRPTTDDEHWAVLIKPKAVKSEADKAAQKAATEADRLLHRPHLAHVERIGPDFRSGRDVMADDLIEHFGFRAIEFGEWLPQDERQTVLNMAFDSLCDLADVLKLPPKAISLDGTLALAFGSRGTGGRNAALAHYEPLRVVMNLTRMNGAGCLAHEWVHALDWHLSSKKGEALSEQAKPGKAMEALLKTMMRRPGDPATLIEHFRAETEKSLEWAWSWPTHSCFESSEKAAAKARMDEAARTQLAILRQQVLEIVDIARKRPSWAADGFDGNGIVPAHAQRVLRECVEEAVKDIVKGKKGYVAKVRDACEGNLYHAFSKATLLYSLEACVAQGLPVPEACLQAHPEDSTYLRDAKKLDESRSSPYWATRCELLARAGAAVISDRLVAEGRQSDYLVFGAEGHVHEANPRGNPNPVGEIRAEINDAFTAWIDDYRLSLISDDELLAQLSAEAEAPAVM